MEEYLPTATIKFGGQDAPWLVFKGTTDTIRRQILEAFSLTDIPDQSLAMLVAQTSAVAQGLWKLSKNGDGGLGAAVVDITPDTPSNASTGTSTGKPKQEANPYAGVIEEIEQATSKDDLKGIYAKHAAAYKASAEVQAAFKAQSAKVN